MTSLAVVGVFRDCEMGIDTAVSMEASYDAKRRLAGGLVGLGLLGGDIAVML